MSYAGGGSHHPPRWALMYAEAPPPGVSQHPGVAFSLPPPPVMGMMPNGGPRYSQWGGPPVPQGAAWGVPLQQQGNLQMMQMQQPVRGNAGIGALPRETERDAGFAMRRGPEGTRNGGNNEEMVQKAEKAARQVYEELVREEKHISVTKVVQGTLSALGVSSFELLGFRMQDVSCLRKLALVEGKVNAIIHSHIAAKRITTLYDLGCELTQEEGVSDFEDLGIGPLLLHPLVVRYFSPPDEVLSITAEEVMQHLSAFIGEAEYKRVEVDEFMAYLQNKKKAPTRLHLGVRIQSLGLHVGAVLRAKRAETEFIKNWEALAKSLPGLKKSSVVSQVSNFLSSQNSLKEGLKRKRNHIYFDSDDEEETDRPSKTSTGDERSAKIAKIKELFEQLENANNAKESLNNLPYCTDRMGTVTGPRTCPYPSAAEERLRAKEKTKTKAQLDDKYRDANEMSWSEVMDFVRILKDACKNCTVSQVMKHLVDTPWQNNDFPLVPKKKNLTKFLKSRLGIGLLYVAVISVRMGLWDNSDMLQNSTQEHQQEEAAAQTVATAAPISVDCDASVQTGTKPVKDKIEASELNTEAVTKCSSCSVPKVPLHRVQAFITQAIHASSVGSTSDDLDPRLCKYFNVEKFEDLGWGSLESVVGECNHGSKTECSSSSILYLGALVSAVEDGPSSYSSVLSSEMSSSLRVGSLGAKTNADALQALINAPMLVNLSLWSQWDTIFAPTLGPFLSWLEREGFKGNIYTLVTDAGVILKIDGTATADNFLPSLISGDSKSAAVQLTSIVALYGGINHAPSALLKTYATKALTVLTRSFASEVHSEDYSRVAMLLLDILCVVPQELQFFAAKILLPAFSSAVEYSASILLKSCRIDEHRFLLHKLGVAFGIEEWINNFKACVFKSSMTEGAVVQDISSNEMRGEELNQESALQWPSTKIFNESELICAEGSPAISGNHEQLPSVQSQSDVMETDSTVERIENDQASTSAVVTGLSGSTQSAPDFDIRQRANDVVEFIRREEFGIGQDLKVQEQELLARQHARMGRALHRLSQDLYSQDSHFVLELVQNADDNSYAPGVEAALVFVVQSGHVMVFNNEVGFTSANLRALCDVGNSTKTGSSTGYIGHKGIGFKSVFRVTDAPEIHSNGFNVKFDITESNLGFILPTIIEARQCAKSYSGTLELVGKKVFSHEKVVCWNTRIDLPIKSSISNGKGMASLAAKFDDIHPSLLLFLHRLRCIAVQNDVVSATKLMHREDLANGLVRVVHDKGHATWLVARHQVLAGVPRPNILETEIALAFPLEDLIDGNYKAVAEQQQVFAFLPLRSYGLRFIVQCDFLLPSSREEVDSDSAWNQWLRSEIPEVFVKAAEIFKTLPTLGTRGAAVSNYLKFVPLEGEVLGFFSVLPRLIHTRLQAIPCLPVEGSESSWSFPCAVLMRWSETARELIPDALLKEHLGLQYLDKEVDISDSLARSLGVQKYGSKTLVALMKSVSQKSDGVGRMGLEWIRHWLIELHACLQKEQEVFTSSADSTNESILFQELRAMQFIPLASGSFTAIKDGPVWFANHPAELQDGAIKPLGCFPLLYAELRTVHPTLFHSTSASEVDLADDPNVTGKVISMLHQLGVRPISAHHVLKSHVIPAMADENCTAKETSLLLQYIGYAKWHLGSSCNQCTGEIALIFEQLKQNALISTNNGVFRMGEKEPIHFGKSMGSPFDAQDVLSGCSMKWNEVSDSYLQLALPGQITPNVESWRKFLSELGVTDFVQVIPVKKIIKNKAASLWKDEVWEGVNKDDTGCVLEDWESPELVDLISTVTTKTSARKVHKKAKRCSAIFSILDKLWQSNYASRCRATFRISDEKQAKQGLTFASWVLQVRKLKWVKSSLDSRLHTPASLFQRCESVNKILGNHAAYLRTQIHNVHLTETLGLRTEVTVDDCLSLLQHWGSSNQVLEASVAQMARLYLFLAEHAKSKKVLATFKSQPAIFFPSTSTSSREEVVQGSLLPLEKLFWSDPTGALSMLHSLHGSSCEKRSAVAHGRKEHSGNSAKALSTYYPELRSFFVEQCLVREKPEFYGYISILKQFSAITSPFSVLNEVLEVLAALCGELDSGRVTKAELQDWKAHLQESDCTVLPTMSDQWVALRNDVGFVCVCDDEKIGQEFVENAEILYFLCTKTSQPGASASINSAEERCSRVQRFYASLSIPLLSQAVKREVILYGSHDTAKVEALVSWALPYAQRYIRQHHIDVYNHVEGKPKRKLLKQLRCLVVDQLYFQYSLQSGQIRSSRRAQCGCLLEENTLYVAADRCEDHCMIYTELSRLFFSGQVNQQLANFLHLITMMASLGSQEAEVELYMANTQGIQPLPAEVAPWRMKQRLEESNPATIASPVKGPSRAETYLERHAKVEEWLPVKIKPNQSYCGWPPRSWVPLPTVKSTAMSSIVVEPEFGTTLNRITAVTRTEEIHSSGVFTSPDASTRYSNGTGTGMVNEGAVPRSIGFTSSTLSADSHGRAVQQNTARENLVMSTGTEQQQITGRSGEEVAYQYLIKKYGAKEVKWVNEDGETGAPFDMIVRNESGKQEFVEVKTTRSQDKDWFEISAREWEFAEVHGDLYTVLRVILPNAESSFQIIRFSNPVKLCRERTIQLALILPFSHVSGSSTATSLQLTNSSSPQRIEVADLNYKVTLG